MANNPLKFICWGLGIWELGCGESLLVPIICAVFWLIIWSVILTLFLEIVCKSFYFQIKQSFPIDWKKLSGPNWEKNLHKQKKKNPKKKHVNVIGKIHNACRPLSDTKRTPCMHTAGIWEQQHIPYSLTLAHSSCLNLLVKGGRTNHCRVKKHTCGHCFLWGSGRSINELVEVLFCHDTSHSWLFDAETELAFKEGGD